MRNLILGGNGFIGSHLVDKLLAEGHFVRVFDRYEEHYRKPLSEVDYVFADFGNRGLLNAALDDIDVVYHLISTTVPKTSNDDPVFDVQSNLIDTLFLLEQCVAHNVKKVVYISSGGTIYGSQSTLPLREESSTNPECSYGIVKLSIEKYLSLFKQLHNLNYTVVRPSNPFGPRQNPSGIQGAIAVFLGKVARNEPLEIWGDGSVVRDYIYIHDLISGIFKAACNETTSNIFNIASGIGYSLNNIIEILRNITGQPVSVTYLPKRMFDVPEIYLDITRARKEISWEPSITIEDGIQQTWEFISSLNR